MRVIEKTRRPAAYRPARFPHAKFLEQPSSRWLEASRLTARPPRPLVPERIREIADKIDFKRVYTEVSFAIGSEFIRHVLDDSAPIDDLQGNKKRIPYCQMWGNIGATANEQTSEVRLYKGLRKKKPISSIVQRDSHMLKSGMTRLGIEPGSRWWEASSLIAQPPRPQVDKCLHTKHDLSSASPRNSKRNTAHLLRMGTNLYTRERDSGRLRMQWDSGEAYGRCQSVRG
ncbi:hypothetical protein PR048_012151 [Dryococelus australis]|uniref:Uncharacterized protein n=1 Tax=Dryococelus australis TaxID=614101 RepID=A0ABQ9HNJ5_9NEOP|nr:hypothetical protein PR048_012151 [Dryococelus australis]